jgi:1,4-alpha-glucan branching enzyme
MAPDQSSAHIGSMKGSHFQKSKAVPPTQFEAMKHNQNQAIDQNAGLKLVPVRFEFTDPTAKSVCLAGSFNHWQPEAKTLHSSGAGNWWKETALAPGSYEYCLVVDGKWMPDPSAPETVANPFGGRNSILHVAISPEAAHLANAENSPLKNENNEHIPLL